MIWFIASNCPSKDECSDNKFYEPIVIFLNLHGVVQYMRCFSRILGISPSLRERKWKRPLTSTIDKVNLDVCEDDTVSSDVFNSLEGSKVKTQSLIPNGDYKIVQQDKNLAISVQIRDNLTYMIRIRNISSRKS